MRNRIILVLVLLLAAASAYAGDTADIIRFHPTSDDGKYITQHQSKTLHQWGFNVGMITDYAYEPLEYADPSGTRRRGIVDDLLMTHFQGAIGWTDWWSTGFDFPMVWWESFYDPSQLSSTVQKENLKMKMADPRVEMKFRILDIDRYHVGLAVVPYVYIPIGDDEHFLGTNMWSPGGTIVFDADIKNRVFLTFNAGYRYYKETQYDTVNPDAVIDDTLNLGGGINVRITDSWAMIGEVWTEPVIKSFFKNQLQTPTEFLVAGKFTPQAVPGLGVTVGGGRGITTGIGNPEFRAFVGVNYRRPKIVKPPAPVEVEAVVEEKIVITQKVHFEFNKDIIRPVSYPILDDVVMLLKKNTQIKSVRVEGHTDWIGSDEYNQNLSERRARSVRDYLISKGIEPERMLAVGFGESRPIADNETSVGRARNRRVEFTVVETSAYY